MNCRLSFLLNWKVNISDFVLKIAYVVFLAFTTVSKWVNPKKEDNIYLHKFERKYVILKVHAAGVNPVDAKHLYGDKVPHVISPLIQYLVEGFICGIDVSGVVVEAESGCGYSVGDEVFGTIPPLQGSFTEYVRAPTDFLCLKPTNFSFVQAAAVPLVGLTALQSLTDNNIQPGQNVLVLGASGGTGYVATQVARIKGAHVTAVCGKRNDDFVKSLGANVVIHYDVVPDLIKELRSIVEKRGPFHIIFDSVSSHDPRDQAFGYEARITGAEGVSQGRILSESGKYIILGGLWLDWIKAHIRRFMGINLFGPNRELFWVRFPEATSYLQELKQYCEAGSLKVKIAEALPFTAHGLQESYRMQMERKVVGKLVIEVINQSK